MNNLPELAKLVRYYSLISTTEAGSGHPSSSLSAADVMTALMLGSSRKDAEDGNAEGRGSAFFKADLENPNNSTNDRLIFSKGHASPLFYSLYAVAGQLYSAKASKGESANGASNNIFKPFNPEEILTLRKFGSRFEGHPTLEFPYTEVATGSLGQGLGIGVGMALNAKLDKLDYRTYVLLGDSEMAEGSVWEAMAIASYYQLNNLTAIVDVNRLGQRGETMLGHDVESYKKRAEAFGWETVVIDGHNMDEIEKAFSWAVSENSNIEIRNPKQIQNNKSQIPNEEKPRMIIAKTIKGKGVSFMEDKDGWHGKALSREELGKALAELGEVDKSLVGEIEKPKENSNIEYRNSKQIQNFNVKITEYTKDKPVATRKAYGNALVNVLEAYPNAVVLDAEVSNSTFSEFVKKSHPERFFEMFIAEQNMVGTALGFSRRGKIPFISTFAAFFSRAFDQIRMSQYADSNIKFIGSHAGVSIGEDGASQMALEDIAMFRTVLGGVVLYPSDAVSTERLVGLAAKHHGNVYIRTTRKETSIFYNQDDEFKIGGSKVLKSSENDKATVVGAGVTLHEALAAYEELKKAGINIRVIDLYSIKPLDVQTLQKAAKETGAIITVEDHFKEGGLGEAVAAALCTYEVHHILESLAVTKMPKSGKPDELLAYEEINSEAIIRKVKQVVSSKL